MASHEDDLGLLLSLQDRVLETPPASPSSPHSHSPGYLSDDGSPRQRGKTDLSVFKNVVEHYLDYEPKQVDKPVKSKSNSSNDLQVEKFSGLRISLSFSSVLRNQLVSPAELSERLSDIRFIRLTAIKNLLVGDTLYGCWATVGVLTEKGNPKTSSIGQNYSIWKIGCLDENAVSLFLFGDAYSQYCKEQAGTVFALFSCSVRKDAKGSGFSLSVGAPNQILKIGTSADYGVCKGKRKDGMACTLVINKRQGVYCQYHKSKASERFSTKRTELMGGNLRTAFRNPLRSEGIYMVDPLTDRTNLKKPTQPVKILSVDGLKKALRNGDKVTTNRHSQGIRFLNAVTEKMSSKFANGASGMSAQQMIGSEKRKLSTVEQDTSLLQRNKPLDPKRKKIEQEQAWWEDKWK
ncbi:PREDICTED: protein MCM10 homolog isoform X1 [Theobroma cacao]|uniref:Protein MCM10 homolog isoform X1 n=1 Tax=Theobroma cacao TaxID=3641 RepID=A0AB32VXX9_THECC|nr:PREDICTED: protein MCM10 homolog isoform X1 [Theobroma cacao]